MSSDPFADRDPEQTVVVLPRHLAGAGPADLRTTWPFPFDKDWSLHQPEDGNAIAASPCLRLRTSRFEYGARPGEYGEWIATGHRDPFGPPTWEITFSPNTPLEFLRDVHTELLDLYLEDPRIGRKWLLGEDCTAPHEVYAPLLVRGWSHRVKTDGTQLFRSPNALATVKHQYATTDTQAPAWTARGGPSHTPTWSAEFSHRTPTRLVASFTASLISTEPVLRTVKDIPAITRRHVYEAPSATASQSARSSSPVAPAQCRVAPTPDRAAPAVRRGR
ncbi:DUF317 domain-containing protein [Streptomyces sp. NPDC001633]|uniref:DUF317 domain-containing protein n=1 Tax=Streptomyces sp. NPDC001633 TaxID=3364595 RepID=UPI0036B2852A